VQFRSLQEQLDTATSGGKLIFHFFGALAEFERDLIKERTMAGLAAARARGRKGGRPRKLGPEKLRQLRTLTADKTSSVRSICHTLGISKATFYRYLNSRRHSAWELIKGKPLSRGRASILKHHLPRMITTAGPVHPPSRSPGAMPTLKFKPAAVGGCDACASRGSGALRDRECSLRRRRKR
jgi:hypothetical protein